MSSRSDSKGAIRVRPARPEDRAALARMREALWPEDDAATHASEIDAFFAGGLGRPFAVFLAFEGGGGHSGTEEPVGFAEFSVRPCADGCTVSVRPAHLAGWTGDHG